MYKRVYNPTNQLVDFIFEGEKIYIEPRKSTYLNIRISEKLQDNFPGMEYAEVDEIPKIEEEEVKEEEPKKKSKKSKK